MMQEVSSDRGIGRGDRPRVPHAEDAAQRPARTHEIAPVKCDRLGVSSGVARGPAISLYWKDKLGVITVKAFQPLWPRVAIQDFGQH
jgi:hypothetical protein